MDKFYEEHKILENIIHQTNLRELDEEVMSKPEKIKWNGILLGNDDIFERRKSVKSFDRDKSISQHALLEILKSNEDYLDQFKTHNNSAITQYILPERVEGSFNNRCLYSYNAKKQTLQKEWELPADMTKKDLVLQEEFADGAAIIIFTVSLRDVVNQFGNAGYKMVLQDTGSVAHYSWMQSLAYGYEGTVFAGFLQKPLQKFTDIDGYNKSQLFAFTLGNEDVHQLDNPSHM